MKKLLYLLPLVLLFISCQENPDYGEPAVPFVRIVEDSVTIMKGETRHLTLSCPITGVEWQSSDDKVVMVNYQGRVTGIELGEAIVSASRESCVSHCVVTVVADTVSL